MRQIAISTPARIALTFAFVAMTGCQKISSSTKAPEDFAEFRFAVRQAVEAVQLVCPISSAVRDKDILLAATTRLSRFRNRIAGSAYAEQFDIARADVNYIQKITHVECAPLGSNNDPRELARLQLVADERARLLEAMLEKGP